MYSYQNFVDESLILLFGNEFIFNIEEITDLIKTYVSYTNKLTWES